MAFLSRALLSSLLLIPLACNAAPPPVEDDDDDDKNVDNDGAGGGADPGDIDPGDGNQSGGTKSGGIDLDALKDKPPTPDCGDGKRGVDEACDDGGKDSDDGCAGNCRYVEEGFICPEPGKPCRPFAKCGDGVLSFPESCDDGGIIKGDGCSDNCKEELGYRCQDEPSVCTPTQCGDGLKEGAEACEHVPASLIDGQAVPFKGCTVDTCQFEPNCLGFSCESPCGDGLIIGEEANEGRCDDGNIFDGDGCSSACEQEAGYTCTRAKCEIHDPDGDGMGPCMLRVPVIYRDLKDSFADILPEYEEGAVDPCPPTPGLVKPDLLEGKPVFSGVPSGCIQSAATFDQWYNDGPESQTIISEILLFDDNGSGSYVNRFGKNGDGLDPTQFSPNVDGNPHFFPLDDHALALPYTPIHALVPPQFGGADDWSDSDRGNHNFAFTSEILYWFTYTAEMDATLEFFGDDDVFVFVNGKLAVDLGGAHIPEEGSVSFKNGQVVTDYVSHAPLIDGVAPTPPYSHLADSMPASEFGLQDGKVYEIKIFQAERKIYGSSFQLTLAGFNAARSDCVPTCGDGVIAAGEECDDGPDGNVGGYNRCSATCTLGAFCGDGKLDVDGGEQCDDADPAAPPQCRGCREIVTVVQ